MKKYYDVRVEPHFLVLVNGGELTRVTGFNFAKLHEVLENCSHLHHTEFEYYGDSKGTYEPFTNYHERLRNTLEHDKDVLRPELDKSNTY